MIGRFAHIGTYRELLDTQEFMRCLGGGGIALAGYLWGVGGMQPQWLAEAMALAAVGLNGLPIIREAINGLRQRRVNVDELVSLAIIGALLQGEYLTAAVVSFIMTLGALLEGAISDAARASIGALAEMTPETATKLDGDTPVEVPLDTVRPGDLLLVRPGERIPVDGVIVKGVTAVDESTVTGEPVPRDRGAGDRVFSATLNYNGVIEIVAEHVGEDTTLGRVVRLVNEAEEHKPTTARLVDRYAKWFTPLVLVCAAAAWFITGESSRAVAVLVAGCPCSLLMAAPTATVAAVARAARKGILVKGGRHLEALSRVDAAFFDKTGTLTLGKPCVRDVSVVEGMTRQRVLALAAGVERHCTHPLARAVVDAASAEGVEPVVAECVLMEQGLGVRAGCPEGVVAVGSAAFAGGVDLLPGILREAHDDMVRQGVTPLVVTLEGMPMGVLAVTDTVRDSARDMAVALRGLGVHTLGILSGDHDEAVRRTGEAVGIVQHRAGLKPQDKLDIIRDAQLQGRRVLFVGDGVNDAPALAGADVGIAMGAAGTHVALETAGMALTRDEVGNIPFLIGLSRRMLRIVKMNIALGLLFNTVAVMGSAYGLLSPIAASVFHNVGSIFVVLLSASLAFSDRGMVRGQ